MCRQSMQTKAMDAVGSYSPRETSKTVAEEGGELGLAHLAGSHGELAVADPPEPADMAVDRHVVGRVGEDESPPLAAMSRRS